MVPINPTACDYADYPAKLRDSPQLLQRAGIEVPENAPPDKMFTLPAPPDLMGRVQSTMGHERDLRVVGRVDADQRGRQ